MEAARIEGILGDELVSWEHVGSTAVPGLMAKPILDLMPIVRDIKALVTYRSRMESAGYNWYGEYGLPGRRYFNRNDPATNVRIANIHVYEADNPEVMRHLAFRDYLRANHQIARQYEELKRTCADLCPDDVNAYNDCKNDWIKAIELPAIQAWSPSKPNVHD